MQDLIQKRLRRMTTVESPCIGICELKDNICIGCNRTVEQITNWETMRQECVLLHFEEDQARRDKLGMKGLGELFSTTTQ